MAQITYTIQAKRDTAANWTANNPTLAEGEFGFETDTKKLKIGDGNTLWASLPYPDAVIGMFGDIHYQTSTISTLNKAPNFYA